jgi:hypothetical protein
MWQIHALLAHDILNDRRRDAELAMLNRLYWDGAAAAGRPAGPGPVRRAIAGALRWLGSSAGTLAEHACLAAARLEGRAA